jgi:rubredoxin
MEARRRKLVQVESQNFQGWACSECAWVFKPSGPPAGESIDEMKMHYKQQRDKEFASHVCEKYPKATKNPG